MVKIHIRTGWLSPLAIQTNCPRWRGVQGVEFFGLYSGDR